jgi:hypothetical protein
MNRLQLMQATHALTHERNPGYINEYESETPIPAQLYAYQGFD